MSENPACVEACKYGYEQQQMCLQRTDAAAATAAANHSGGTPAPGQNDPFLLGDIHQGKLMHEICRQYGTYVKHPFNYMIGLAVDSFVSFRGMGGAHAHKEGGKQYSVLPLCLVAYNLPPHMRTRLGAVHVAGIIPGPSPKVVQPFLEVIVDELLYLWLEGVSVTYPKLTAARKLDASNVDIPTGRTVARCMLIHIMGDYRGNSNLCMSYLCIVSVMLSQMPCMQDCRASWGCCRVPRLTDVWLATSRGTASRANASTLTFGNICLMTTGTGQDQQYLSTNHTRCLGNGS